MSGPETRDERPPPGYSSAPPAAADTIPAAEYVDEDGPALVRSLSEMVEAIEERQRRR
jgi:hypothetical protein